MKKIFAAIFTLLLTPFLFTVYADGETAQTHNHFVCGAADCEENHEDAGKVDWQAWNGDTTVGTVSDTEVKAVYLYLEDDLVITDTLDITNVAVYLCLNGKTLTINKAGYPAVRVGENQKFVLCDCKETGKITGAKGPTEDVLTRRGTINCQSGSNFVMYGGSIADNIIEGANGGGVYVSGGTFTMYGGSIRNNQAPNGSGGAVSVENGKIITYGGEMTGNYAVNGGAIHLKGNTGAEIQKIKAIKNTAKSMGGAIFTETSAIMEIREIELAENTAANGAGLYLRSVKNNVYANIRSAYIHDNTATASGGGLFLNADGYSNYAISIHDSRICDNNATSNGGGIYAQDSAMLNLYGGSITGNTAGGDGGGICMRNSTYFNIYNYQQGTASIKENSANRGGGIYTNASAFILNGTNEIMNNTASTAGGGIYIAGSGMWLIVTKSTITQNTAPMGGGICLNKGNSGYELDIGGGTSVIGNTSADGLPNNLYLNNGRMFQFRTGLTGNEKIGVSVSGTPTLEEPVDIEWVFSEQYHDNGGDRSNLIIPDNDNYEVIYQNERHKLIPKIPTCTVTFDPNNGETEQTVTVTQGDTVSGFDYPMRDGYIFDAWYSDGAAYDFAKPVTEDLTLTARWIKEGETALCVSSYKIIVYNQSQPAVLIMASYDGNRLLDAKTKELTGAETEEYIGVFEIGLNTENATKIAAFLLDMTGEMRPLCESAAADYVKAIME